MMQRRTKQPEWNLLSLKNTLEITLKQSNFKNSYNKRLHSECSTLRELRESIGLRGKSSGWCMVMDKDGGEEGGV